MQNPVILSANSTKSLAQNVVAEELVTTKELAQMLGVTERTIRDAAKNKGVESTFRTLKTNGGNQSVKVFNEEQATIIKQEIQKHHNLATRRIDSVSTEEKVMTVKEIAATLKVDFGTDSAQVKGAILPTGQSMSLHGVDFTSSESVTTLIQSLVNNANNLYKYSNDILSRFSFLDDLPVACSTANVDIATGGERTIDGVSVSIGQLVFLKDQTDAKENGFYEVQSGAWNRYAGFTSSVPAAFKHKLVFVKAGTANKGKVFYLNGDFEQIGSDKLNFKESNFSPYAIANKAVIRDKDGRMRAKAPKDKEDVARKQEFDESTANTGSTEGRNLLTVLGVTTVAEAMKLLHERCNGEGQGGFFRADDWRLP